MVQWRQKIVDGKDKLFWLKSILRIKKNLYSWNSFYIFIFYIYLSDTQESVGGVRHRVTVKQLPLHASENTKILKFII